jgi:uncharacterized RDD family membrane protein YckC
MLRAYPGIVTRAVAFLVDVVIIDVIAFTVTVGTGLAVAALTPGKTAIHTPAILATAAGWLAFGALYLVALWTLVGRTPGMRVLGIRLTCADGGRVTFWSAVRRLVGLALSFLTLGLGFLMMLVDDRGRALQDRVGGTLVVR